MKGNQKVSGVRSTANCRICGSASLKEFLDLGSQPLANAFVGEACLRKPEARYPLRVMFCVDCNLVQLGEVVDSELLFHNYVYCSSGMPASPHFRDYAEDLIGDIINSKDDLVVEIGSNDGHFLAVVKESHEKILGVDPAQNIARMANQQGIPTIPEFFTESIAKEIVKKHGAAKVIVGNNVVGHIDDYDDLLRGIDALLTKDGVFVFEAPYLVDMFENSTFDTIYHEHLSYLAVRPLQRLFDRFGMEIFRFEIHPVQGKSLRAFVARKGARPVEPAVVRRLIEKEKLLKLHELGSYFDLAKQIQQLKQEVVRLLRTLKNQSKKIAAYGAPAKGNTLLNYFQIGPDVLDYATEALASKIGLYTPGMHIPVVDIAWARQSPPDYYLLLAWNYKDVVLRIEQEFLEGGGKFIMPIGSERIL